MEKNNKLINEKSPYLLQHANNPVEWYPWGDEAFVKAGKENKPIFLSIGYSTCHWCHVMAHESFEDEEVAKLMNDSFVSIKVDREERPDIDKIYMNVCQMLTGSGGWPLTVVMTPDKKPFFAGTYFPKHSRMGRIGMLELIPRIKLAWSTQKNELVTSAERIATVLQHNVGEIPHEDELGEPTIKFAYEELNQKYDRVYGGFGLFPKFPTPHNLLFLLTYWKRYKSSKALEMVERTLRSMRLGGIYDHIGFGFHRYSTDQKWLVPHFEKMLYDQALISLAYIEAYQATKKEEYRKTAEEIFSYVLRDMTSPEGGFYSAEDADSEGVEGKFYLWTRTEINEILEKDEAELIIKVFNVESEGNFSEEATGRKTGENILHLTAPLSDLSIEMEISEAELSKRIETARQKLFKIREKRIHPHKDDKILTSWNGLMIAALSKGAQVFGESKYNEAAEKASNFILKEMFNSEGRLLHTYREGQSGILAYLDDYAFFIWGLLELFEATFDTEMLQKALKLNEELLIKFWDNNHGAFYFTAADSEDLLVRQKEIYDGAIPSGNSVAMLNLQKISKMKMNPELVEKALKIGKFFAEQVNQAPSAHSYLLTAVDFAIGPSYLVLIAGYSDSEDTITMINAIRCNYLPNAILIHRPSEIESPFIDEIAESYKFQNSVDGKSTSYVCENFTCKAPVTNAKKMLELLDLS